MPLDSPSQIVLLDAGGTSALIEVRADQAPILHYWGRSLSTTTEASLRAIVDANRPQHRVGDIDDPRSVSLVPAPAEGWTGTPGMTGRRATGAFSHALRPTAVEVAPTRLRVSCEDAFTRIGVTIEIEVTRSGLVRQRLGAANRGDDAFDLQELDATFPVPDWCTEILDLTGRWMRERVPQRHALVAGRFVRESRKGRPGADASLLLMVGERGFSFADGEVRGIHVAWSGNHRMAVERSILGGTVLTGGELLLPGEGELDPGETYSTPWVYASWGRGLDELAARFHRELRSAAAAPAPRSALLNVWEAVYFDHRLDTLTQLADRASEIGIELFVLDDGWFLGRRDDRRALGDWFVDPDVWPDGLDPLISRVRAAGLRFGIWVEPEMVSVDSRLARAHPDWILGPGDRLPPVGKWQQVLNVGEPEVYAYLLDRLDWLLSNHDISYLKWDHNRDVLEAGDRRSGRAALRRHTQAVYRLIDELRARHPHVEIENCASGGSRIDLEILARTQRTWISDCADPVERARVQQYTGLLVPIEMMGNDIAAPRAHTTGRTTELDLRGTVALLGWLGLQYDLNAAGPDELADLAAWVALYKETRELMHGGRAFSVDPPDASVIIRGVVAQDASDLLLTIVQLDSPLAPSAGRIRVPGLVARDRYDVRVVTPAVSRVRSMAYTGKPWVQDGVELTGELLGQIGLDLPVLDPQQGLVVRIRRVAPR